MALGATIYHFTIGLSDVDRGVYETLDLRVAQHPSENLKYLLTRTLAYCLSYEEGISFSKGGLSAAEEPPIAIHDPTGRRTAWIDIGAPSRERLHKATKSVDRVAVFTSTDLTLLRREAASGPLHKIDSIEVFLFDPAFLARIEEHMGKRVKWELVRTDGQLYVTVGSVTIDGSVVVTSLRE